ncbi:MAG TPA: YsnF/AvaK domain-containing protein [Candidatus Angelobacter sp.]|nr:YsnF/AvaK domain-containing protein [Candidatus Angelobacter sp.]
MAIGKVPETSVGMGGCVIGLFRDDSSAEAAIQRLREAGFTAREIGMASAGRRQGAEHAGFWSKVAGMFGKEDHPTTAADLEDSLRQCGLTAEKARYFNESLADGDVLLSIRTGSAEKDKAAREILKTAGADLGMGTAGARAPATSRSETRIPVQKAQGERRIELVGEMLRIHKDRVQTGEVNMHKEVITENQHIEVPVKREELVVERTPVENADTTAQVGSGDKEIRVPLTEERVRVEKKPVVTEEVKVGKREVEEVKDVSDTVRHEELRTEQKGEVKPPSEKKDKAA